MSQPMLPMRGGALGHLAVALRLSGKTVTTGPTRKRLFADSAEVSDTAFNQAVGDLVERLFQSSYLRSRGLEDEAGLEHNRFFAQALSAALDRWNAAATMVNVAKPTVRLPLPFHLEISEVSRDVTLRVAAYDVLFGRRHPIRDVLTFLVRGGAVREWWRAFERSFRDAPSLNELVRRTHLHRQTLKNLSKGELKTAGVLEEVATGLGQMGARDPSDRLFDSPRIKFELRVACAIDELQRGVRKHPDVADIIPAGFFWTIHRALSQMDRAQVEEVLVRGVSSEHTGRLQPAIETWTLAQIAALMERERGIASYIESLQHAGRHQEAARIYAARTRAIEAELRGPNDDELVRPFADMLAWDAACFEAKSSAAPVVPARPDKLDAELAATALLLNQRSPWKKSQLSDEDAFREAVRIAPHLREPRRDLARLLSLKGQHDEAIAGARELVVMFPDDLSLFEELIEQIGFAERWGDLLDALTTDRRSSPSLRASRGAALVKLNRLAEAEPELDAVLRDDPRNQLAMRAKAELLRKTRRHPEAGVLERRAEHLHGGGIDRVVGTLANRRK